MFYRCFDVPAARHRARLDAPSIGQFVNTELEGALRYEKVQDSDRSPLTHALQPLQILAQPVGNGPHLARLLSGDRHTEVRHQRTLTGIARPADDAREAGRLQ